MNSCRPPTWAPASTSAPAGRAQWESLLNLTGHMNLGILLHMNRTLSVAFGFEILGSLLSWKISGWTFGWPVSLCGLAVASNNHTTMPCSNFEGSKPPATCCCLQFHCSGTLPDYTEGLDLLQKHDKTWQCCQFDASNNEKSIEYGHGTSLGGN